MGLNMEKLSSIAQKRSRESVEKAEQRKKDRKWLRMSQEIALCLHYYLRKSGTTQKCLAERIGVSPSYVGKLLKGGENLTLETISKIQEAIGENLITTCSPYVHNGTIHPYHAPAFNFAVEKVKFKTEKSSASGYSTMKDAA